MARMYNGLRNGTTTELAAAGSLPFRCEASTFRRRGRAAGVRLRIDARDREVHCRVAQRGRDPVPEEARLGELGVDAATVRVIATGYLAPVVLDECRCFTHHAPWLTLRGLELVFERNA